MGSKAKAKDWRSDMNQLIELVGMMDSPFVRRVAIALTDYRIPFTLNPLSVYSNVEQLSEINPLLTVPVLQGEGISLSDSGLILEWLDERAGRVWTKSNARFKQSAAIANMIALKIGELYRHKIASSESLKGGAIQRRLERQIQAGLLLLESSVTDLGDWVLHHESVAIATSYRFTHMLSDTLDLRLPITHLLASQCAILEKLPCFAQCDPT
jgi:glutathione S-transferase